MTKSKPKTTRLRLRDRLPDKLAAWFTGAVVLGGLLSCPFADSNAPPDQWNLNLIVVLCFISSILAMGSLVAVWCSVLGGWKPYLIGGVALLIAGVVLALNSGAGPDWWTIVFLPLAIAIPTCFTLEFIKFIFGKFTKIGLDGQAYEEGLQFRLVHLFITTTVVALLFGIWQAASEFFGGFGKSGYTSLPVTLACITAVLAINTLFSVWAILGKSMFWRLTILVPAAVGVIALGIALMGPRGQVPVWPLIFGVCFIATAVLLLLLRYEGYRFVRRSQSSVTHTSVGS